jgi:phosphatidate cytidylyltransferase
MLQRAITGAVFVAVLLGAIFYHPITFSILFLIFTIIGCSEGYKMAKKAGASVQAVPGIIAAVLLYATISGIFLFQVNSKNLLLFLSLPFLLLIMELFRNKKNPFINLSATIFVIFYVAIPFGLLSYIISYDAFLHRYNPNILFGYFLIMWINDTGAYLTGKSLGKTKLFERISPNKTWEGTIGGVLFSFLLAWFLSTQFHELSLQSWLIIAALTSITGSLGDLVESMFKRSTGIKDSGKLMPGHGGVLDRFDGVLVSAPFVAAYLSIIS